MDKIAANILFILSDMDPIYCAFTETMEERLYIVQYAVTTPIWFTFKSVSNHFIEPKRRFPDKVLDYVFQMVQVQHMV